MSSASAGKFQDHYEVLGLEHKATAQAVHAAYAKLAEQFHPKNSISGNKEKFEAVTLAYEILSDPDLRADFNKLKGIGQNEAPIFSGEPFFQALGRDAHLRTAMLCLLYDRRRMKPFTPSISLRNLEGMLQITADELSLALWYLKKRNLVEMDDKSSLLITVEGIDVLEAERPSMSDVLPMLKAAALGAPAEPEAAVEAVPPPAIVEPQATRVPSQSSTGSASRIGAALAKRG